MESRRFVEEVAGKDAAIVWLDLLATRGNAEVARVSPEGIAERVGMTPAEARTALRVLCRERVIQNTRTSGPRLVRVHVDRSVPQWLRDWHRVAS